MASTPTANLALAKPARSDPNWNVTLNANFDALDALAPLAGLAVTPAEVPSASLNVRVNPGPYVKADRTLGSFAGASALALAASSTVMVWLTDAGALATGAAWPAAPHVRLASVATGAAAITSVADARALAAVAGPGVGSNTVSGTFVVQATAGSPTAFRVEADTSKLGFFGSTPQAQAAALTPLVAAAGTASDSIADVGSSHSQAILNNNFAGLSAKVNALVAAMKRHGLMGT